MFLPLVMSVLEPGTNQRQMLTITTNMAVSKNKERVLAASKKTVCKYYSLIIFFSAS